MKKLLILLLLFGWMQAHANHLKGGFFTYTYLGPGITNSTYDRYHVTLTVYMDCAATGNQINDPINFTFFNNTTGAVYANPAVSILKQYQLSKLRDEPCITGDQAICFYKIVIYDLPSIELPPSANGYTIAYQRCCRIINIINIAGNSTSVGNTYQAQIPGTSVLGTSHNNSATFQINDTVVICRNSFFQYPFTATDPDGDSLSYSFCEAYTGASQANPAPTQAADPGTWSFVPYNSGFNGSKPLGDGVTINPKTGLISGTAPSIPGEYVVTVCVTEWRNGQAITVTRKELHVKIGDCSAIQALPAAFNLNGIKVQPGVAGCKSYTYNFANDLPANPLISTYYWEFSDGATYNVAQPQHTFSDTGVYTIKLVVNRGQDCSDSLTTSIKIYPGFFPGFTSVGVCVDKPAQFFDTTRTVYGTVNNWSWDFGETAASNDTSHLKNPTYIYPTAGTKQVTFVVKNSVGCVDTVVKSISILTKPPLTLAFKDTLICRGDSVQLHATGSGNFSWTPTATNIINGNTADPTVYPPTTTPYIVQLDYFGCLATDTVNVSVVPFVTVTAMADTTICATDTLRLTAVTNGLKYLWNNPATLNNPTLLQPTALPVNNPTVYTITASIGHCSTTDNVVVTLVPYPKVTAGNDTIICYNTPAYLAGGTDGSSFSWSPLNTLTNGNTLNPIARPKGTTPYVLAAYDTKGCPKPGRDTVLVVVNKQVIANAGRDTAVVVGQVLQLNASGGVNYSWSPPTALSSTVIPNPKAVYNGSFDSIRYTLTVTDSIGCGDETTVLVKIFRTSPHIFVPTGFTPNGDGRNDYVAAVAVGITKLDYFRIYNRWGQLVFETTENGKGWDGTIGGQPQATGSYVWVVRGTDYTGKVVFDKGTVTLIR